MSESRLSLRVMVNKEKTKVLFAEADSDFVSILLSFLALPLGRIVKLLESHYGDKSPVFGSITSLYKSLANLDDINFSTSTAKLMLLDPPSCFDSIFRKLKLDIFKNSHSREYFFCHAIRSCTHKSVCMYYGGVVKCDCGLPLNREVLVNDSGDDAGGFTILTASFIISDDLKMVPNSAGFFRSLRNIGNTVADGAELWNLNLGTNEIMDLFKCCLLSKTPLTDFILNNNGETISSAANPRSGIFLHEIENKKPITNAKKIILKVMVHKFTNKVLFAEAEDDFIELLFSFIMTPVAGVESLLGTNTCLNNLDNLYRSISDATVDKYFITLDVKNMLMNPKIPHCCKPKNTFLPLNYESAPTLYFSFNPCRLPRMLLSDSVHGSLYTFKSPKGEGNYVKEPATYLVTDDLTVAPFYISSTFAILNRLNIPLSDIVEREVHIGLQEGLSILKASLTSNSALTNRLFNSIMKKQPKQER